MREHAVILGAAGKLGSELCEQLGRQGRPYTALTRASVDATFAPALETLLWKIEPTVLYNMVAQRDSDACERDPELAQRINAGVPTHLAKLARAHGFTLVHISTDYVFGGAHVMQKPYTEDDVPSPINTYGRTKLAGESPVLDTGGIVVRTAALQGVRITQGNVIERVIETVRRGEEYRAFADQITSPTFADDLARQVIMIADSHERGLFHATSHGSCTWLTFAQEILRLARIEGRITPVYRASAPGRAPRPGWSVLENERLTALGMDDLPHWRERLARYLS